MARAFDILDQEDDLSSHVNDLDPEAYDNDDSDHSDNIPSFPVRAVSARVSIPLYCAPEIPLSRGLYDAKVDMWAGVHKASAIPSSQLV
jgi:hypothetical protein